MRLLFFENLLKFDSIITMELIKHPTYKDSRGSYTPILLDTLGIEWTQCCISVNENKFTFRGMHYQTNPAQKKYIKVIQGSIIDFAIDLQSNKLESATLHSNDAVFIPDTKAHGFLTLEPNTIVAYLVQGEWNPDSEHSLIWHQHEELKKMIIDEIDNDDLIISEKDKFGK